MKTLYSKFGYEVKLLESDNDAINVFELLKEPRLIDRRKVMAEVYAEDRFILRQEILHSLRDNNFNSVGLFKDDKLIGISFNNVDTQTKYVSFGYMYIIPKLMATKAQLVLVNYIINHLYRNFTVQIDNRFNLMYHKLLYTFPKEIEFSILTKECVDRLAFLCDEEPKVRK